MMHGVGSRPSLLRAYRMNTERQLFGFGARRMGLELAE